MWTKQKKMLQPTTVVLVIALFRPSNRQKSGYFKLAEHPIVDALKEAAKASRHFYIRSNFTVI